MTLRKNLYPWCRGRRQFFVFAQAIQQLICAQAHALPIIWSVPDDVTGQLFVRNSTHWDNMCSAWILGLPACPDYAHPRRSKSCAQHNFWMPYLISMFSGVCYREMCKESLRIRMKLLHLVKSIYGLVLFYVAVLWIPLTTIHGPA